MKSLYKFYNSDCKSIPVFYGLHFLYPSELMFMVACEQLSQMFCTIQNVLIFVYTQYITEGLNWHTELCDIYIYIYFKSSL